MKALKLSSKLSIFIVTGIILLVGIMGLYVDSLLKTSHYENTNKRMLHGFNRLSTDIARDTSNLHKSLASIESDLAFQASIDLINNYQDKQNYNAILLDEEKKIIAKELLSRVKLSNNDQIYLYDANQELIAFVERDNSEYIQNFISYNNGKPIGFSKSESAENYTPILDKPLTRTLLKHVYLYNHSIEDQGTISFHQQNKQITLKAHLTLFTDDSDNFKAHIEMDRIYDTDYFDSLSADLNMHISGTNNADYAVNSFLLAKTDEIETVDMVQTQDLYIGIASLETEDGQYFYQVRLDKKELLKTLTKVRQEFLLITVSAVFLVLILLYYFFQRNLYTPLNKVMEQVNKIENSSSHLDELKTISENVNQLLSTAFNDELTGTYNRAYFKENIIKILQQNRGHTGIIFFDIDRFKQINDSHGHAAGDVVLKELTSLVQNHIRKEDRLIRWGGEEFVLIVKVANQHELIEVADHLRIKVENYLFTEIGNLTCSFGCQLHSDKQDIETTLNRADELLYQAKATGRNRVNGDEQTS